MTGLVRVGAYAKTPTERKRYQLDYADWLDTGEGVQSIVFTPDLVTVPPLVIDGIAALPSGQGFQYYVSGGLAGKTYQILAEMVTNQAQTKDVEIVMAVRNA